MGKVKERPHKLNTIEFDWQPQLVKEKLGRIKERVKVFIPERHLNDPDMADFGVVKKFKALGWEAALKCYDQERNQIFDKEVEEWVASLQCPPYDKPEEMKLVKKVGNKPVVMAFKTLDEITSFDDNPVGDYVYPPEHTIHDNTNRDPNRLQYISMLFKAYGYGDSLQASDLKIQVKLLFNILLKNVMPRRGGGDTSSVRNYDLPILYALYTGSPKFSFRYLAMHNIWYCRNDSGNSTIPHVRLITTLLNNHGVIPAGAVGLKKIFKPIALRELGTKWKYSKIETHHWLVADKKVWLVPRSDVEIEVEEQGEDVVENEEMMK